MTAILMLSYVTPMPGNTMNHYTITYMIENPCLEYQELSGDPNNLGECYQTWEETFNLIDEFRPTNFSLPASSYKSHIIGITVSDFINPVFDVTISNGGRVAVADELETITDSRIIEIRAQLRTELKTSMSDIINIKQAVQRQEESNAYLVKRIKSNKILIMLQKLIQRELAVEILYGLTRLEFMDWIDRKSVRLISVTKNGKDSLTLTFEGCLRESYSQLLVLSGMTRINISLNTLAERFEALIYAMKVMSLIAILIYIIIVFVTIVFL